VCPRVVNCLARVNIWALGALLRSVSMSPLGGGVGFLCRKSGGKVVVTYVGSPLPITTATNKQQPTPPPAILTSNYENKYQNDTSLVHVMYHVTREDSCEKGFFICL
jgi:hypothetical protein